MKNLQSFCKIVNKHHFDRICNLLEEPGVAASVVYGGSLDKENLLVLFTFFCTCAFTIFQDLIFLNINRVIEPTILLNPPLDAQIMTEEIFGPLLPIITVRSAHTSCYFLLTNSAHVIKIGP